MLVLSRATDESIICETTEPLPAGTRIEVKIVALKGNRVRVGVDAPRSITVHRDEIQERIDGGAVSACCRDKAVACASQSGAEDGPM